MKFLVISKQKELPPMPPEQSLKLIIAMMQIVKQWKKEGKAETSYAFAGQHAGFSILDVESAAELNALVTSRPNHAFLETEIYPLMTMDEALMSVKQTLEVIKAKK